MSEIDSASLEARRALPQLDLNLMTAFDVLLAERNVTRAARRMSVSQSAMSHTLARLRALLDDPVLVRAQGGMVPTPYAEALVLPVREGLTLLGRALSAPPTFEPATSTRTFRIAAPDIFSSLVAPSLWTNVHAAAPRINLIFGPWTEQSAGALARGDLDVAVMARLDSPRAESDASAEGELMRRTLLRDSFVCFIRKGHPLEELFRGRRSKKVLRAFAEAAHVLVSPDGRGHGVVDWVLAEKGLERRVALRVPNFQAALLAAAQADLIVTAPAMLGTGDIDASLRPKELNLLTPPLPLPKHSVDLVWHKRVDADRGHTWLRKQLGEAMNSVVA